MQSQHSSGMATSITIRDVPDKTRNELAARAAHSGRSLQEYLRAQLIELARRPDAETVLAGIRERKFHSTPSSHQSGAEASHSTLRQSGAESSSSSGSLRSGAPGIGAATSPTRRAPRRR